ncbi:MAG: TetR/AcrR family transcriptional regulator [Candidatus Poribacteria bacterium]|nr:TetR/AcrR family transcriptional regulator [Candidatus Poribacteria bacterium]
MRRDLKREMKRKAILDAAVKVFARDGFHLSRIADIASEAQVGHGTVYLYFDGKESVLLTIFEEIMAQVLSDIQRAVKDGRNAEDKLRMLAVALNQIVGDNRELASLLLIETRHTSRVLQGGALDRIGDFIRFFQDILQDGVADGSFRGISTRRRWRRSSTPDWTAC